MSFDADLPADLKKLLQPLYCELCKVQLNSPITAKIHYESKVHEKKVRNWLDEWSKQTGNPIPEIQTVHFIANILLIYSSNADVASFILF